MRCRICGSERLLPVLDLGEQAISGSFQKPGTTVPTAKLEVVKCHGACGLVQLKDSYDLFSKYGDSYEYRSSMNKATVRHLRDIADKIQNLVTLNKAKLIVDIGSNDGTFLSNFRKENILVGVDPMAKKHARHYPAYIRHVDEFFTAASISKKYPSLKAKVVTAISMFHDLENPIAFMREVKKILDDDGIFLIEQNYMPYMIENNLYDTICHEHIEYYGLKQIKYMSDAVGFKIIDVEFSDVNGGSFQVIMTKKTSKKYKQRNQLVHEITRKERVYDGGLAFIEFRHRVEKHKTQLLDLLQNMRAQGNKVYGYGASTKGNTLLQYCGIDKELIRGICDVNPDKIGCVTPGTNIPIISEKEAKDAKPDFFLVLPWHFRRSILNKEKDNIKKHGYKFIFPLPDVVVA